MDKIRNLIGSAGLALALLASHAEAKLLQFQFQDDLNDQSAWDMAPPDLDTVSVVFDDTSGYFQVAMSYAQNEPVSFNRFFLQMQNETTGQSFSAFSENDAVYTGQSDVVKGWREGDIVRPFLQSGDYTVIGSYTIVDHYEEPGWRVMYVGGDEMRHQSATISAVVPEPETYALLATGLWATYAATRRRRLQP